MNRGTFRGSAPNVGDYNGLESVGGSWNGNHGRIHVDEFRQWGMADGQGAGWLQIAGGQRVVNTNPQVGCIAAYPGDKGMVNNILTGTVLVNNASYPFASMYNTAGRIRMCNNSSAGFAVLENNTTVDNLPGVAVAFPTLYSVVGVTTYIANGVACTLGTHVDYYARSAFAGGTGGSLTVTNSVCYQSGVDCLTGSTVTNHTAFKVIQPTGGGTYTNIYGVDIPILTSGTTCTGLRIGAGGQTFTVAPTNQIDLWTGINTFNFSSATFGTAINMTGTMVMQQSASAFLMGRFIEYSPTYKTPNGTSVSLGAVSAIHAAPVFQADNATIADTKGQTMFSAAPTFNVINAGTITTGANTNYQSSGTVAASTTLSAFTHYAVFAPTIGGTVTTQVGLDIVALTGGGTNIGIRNLSSLQQKGAMIASNTAVSVSSNAGTVPVTNYLSTFTNSSAAAMTITMAVTGATDGQIALVRILDFTNVAKGITWVGVDTTNGVTPPANSNGSTTLFLTVGFIFNGNTTLWRCVAVA